MSNRDIPLGRIHIRRPDDSLRDRISLLRHRWRLLVRLAIAPALAYLIATHLFDHQQAFFAPISAILVIAAGDGMRGRTLGELVLGVALGVLVGELIILTIGRGTLQMALVVVLTVVVATLIGIKGMALTQAASSAVLLTAVAPVVGAGNPAVTRFVDALIGGFCGMALVLIMPRNPVRDIDSKVQRLLRQLASVLRGTARALRTNDPSAAESALARARGLQPSLNDLEATAENVSEIARMSPMRWGQRAQLERYVGAIRDFDNAIRDARVLARRATAMLRHQETAPVDLELAIDELARSVDIFADDLSEQDDFDEAQDLLIEAARTAVLAIPEPMTINTAAIAAQVRSLAADLLFATGYTRADIDDVLDFDDDVDGEEPGDLDEKNTDDLDGENPEEKHSKR